MHAEEGVILRCVGVEEEEIKEKLKEIIPEHLAEKVNINLFTHPDGVVDIKLPRLSPPLRAAIEREMSIKLKDNLYGRNEESLEEVVGYLLYLRNLTLAVAESCTGGLISHRLTNIAGSSNYFKGGVVAYNDDAKLTLVGIPADLLKREGSVSKGVVAAMATEVARLLESDFGLATVGYAGPKGEEVGLIYVSLYTKETVEIKSTKFNGDRQIIKDKAATFALDTLRRYLLKI